jgi:hypothetical protein
MSSKVNQKPKSASITKVSTALNTHRAKEPVVEVRKFFKFYF